ncbi:MAG: molybdenum cofactor biosynthesis protein MoaE [Candidatus Eremiobacteraeota bacterium]|nr:molybdenum cofactor biosynthesis protein MoaE [Candidatus Eremiobacteraeota bacterium]
MFRIVREAIDLRVLEAVARKGDGGIVTFCGVVRERADDGRLVGSLWYEAFEPMAVREFETIAAEARDRFGDIRLAIVHRIGELSIGEISVAIVAAARHRGTAFDACRYAIDQLKLRAPIWKQERYIDGDSQWRATYEQG